MARKPRSSVCNPLAGGESDEPAFPFQKHAYLTAVDLESGKAVWKVCPPGAHDSYGTPLVIPNNGEPAVLISTYHHGLAYDVATGEEFN